MFVSRICLPFFAILGVALAAVEFHQSKVEGETTYWWSEVEEHKTATDAEMKVKVKAAYDKMAGEFRSKGVKNMPPIMATLYCPSKGLITASVIKGQAAGKNPSGKPSQTVDLEPCSKQGRCAEMNALAQAKAHGWTPDAKCSMVAYGITNTRGAPKTPGVVPPCSDGASSCDSVLHQMHIKVVTRSVGEFLPGSWEA